MAEPLPIKEQQVPVISIRQLKLHNFRNYQRVEFSAEGDNIVITGPNGAGKTNLLEAISFLAPGRGIRGASLEELSYSKDGNTKNYWAINATISNDAKGISGQNTVIGTGLGQTETGRDKRIVKIDGISQRGQNSLSEYFSYCHLTPRMDSLFVEGSFSRRQYLDNLTSVLMPEHSRHTAIYDSAKSERMKLLKRGSADAQWLNVLEQRMAEKSVAIAAARREATQLLQKFIDEDDSSFPKATLAAWGEVEEDLQNLSAVKAEENLARKLRDNRQTDANMGKTTCGTHKSDFRVVHGNTGFPAEKSSTGEQKAILLSISLASVRAKAYWSGVVPVLLLDEVIAHLDDKKRADLMDALKQLGAQCWMTGTDVDFFAGLQGKTQFFSVANSRILG